MKAKNDQILILKYIVNNLNNMAKKKGQVQQLQEKLNDPDIEQKQQAIRRIIDAMTRGKDVSMLFMDVLKNMQTPSLQLKKLIYLYVMNYAKTRPELAIMGTNTFRKDASDKNNPFLRGLAVRTMGCIRIKDITGYLCDPLKDALKDEDAYVRKTGALCVPKLYEIAPQLIQGAGFLKLLQNLLNDGNATVVSNAIASLSICSEIKGQPLLRLTEGLVQKLLTAMNDCNEWGVVYILDTLSGYIPRSANEAQGIMQRVSSKLAHTNSAVALSAIRLILKYMDYLTHPDSIRAYNNKISAPLITMISRQTQISYLVLKTINLVLQKRPLLLPKQLKIFFVNYHDPLYVKLQKLQVLAKIASNQNILLILHELKQCVQEVDVQFVRRAVRTMGRCAIKLQKSADKCVQCLWETLKTKIPYVVQQAVIVIRDIFRKYPNKYEGLLTDICDNLKSLDDPQAKASIVWIIGQYAQMIENADQILGSFSENFKDEPDVVQQQILLSCMKLYLHRPADGTQILKDLFKYITKQCENPDLRDRGYLYWRMLSTDPALAKKVVLSQRPLLTEQSYTLQTELLQKLIQNIGCLATVYGKQPEDFVKKLKDNANARQVVDEDAEGLLENQNQNQNVDQSEKPKENVNFANNNQSLLGEAVANVPIPGQVIQQPKNQPTDLLDIGNQQPQTQQVSPPKAKKPDSLLDLDDESDKKYSTTINQQRTTNIYATQVQQQQQINFFDNVPTKTIPSNIQIPLVEALKPDVASRQSSLTGLYIKAAFQRQGQQVFLQLIFENQSIYPFSNFLIKLNANTFKLQVVDSSIQQLAILQPGQSREVKITLNSQNKEVPLQGWPYTIECGLKFTQGQIEDAYLFKIPLSMSVAMQASPEVTIQEYKQISLNQGYVKKQQSLRNQLGLQAFIDKFEKNGLKMVFRKDGGQRQLMSFVCILTNGWRLATDVIFDKGTNGVNIQMIIPNDDIGQYFHHALTMIANV